MRITWNDLGNGRVDQLHGTNVEIDGWAMLPDSDTASDHFALTEEPACCAGHLPRDPLARIEVFTTAAVQADGRSLRLAGRWYCLQDDEAGWRYQLRDARILPVQTTSPGFTRRGMLAGGTLLGLAAWMPEVRAAGPDDAAIETARRMLDESATIDIHSHSGSFGGLKRIQEQAPFTPLAAPMRDGRMAVVCAAMVADTPTTHVVDGQRIRPFREPEAGELYAYAQQAFARLHGLVKAQGLRVITDAASLAAARADRPSVIISAEGADFTEGQPDRVDEAYEKWQLRHLQLTHYRVNELGDIQTESPVHGGLTNAGAEVIRRCNARGIIVDVAHGTYDLVKRAASVTTKPLVISHTSLTRYARAYTRRILPNHAKAVAATGGVIGIWPPTTEFPDMTAFAAGIAEMVDAVGIDHVGLGSDMQGLLSTSALPSYRKLPELAAALLARGFKRDEMLKLLGGNYLRVAQATFV